MKLLPPALGTWPATVLDKWKDSKPWDKASTYANENPWKTGAILLAAGVMAAPAVVTGPVLGVAGFTTNGVAVGSAAAGAQSAIGNVAGNSIFAILQSAGAGGYGVGTVNGAVQSIGAVVAGAAAIFGREMEHGHDEQDKDVQNDAVSHVASVKEMSCPTSYIPSS